MSISASLGNIIFFTLVRACGSAVLWVYSSVALQIVCDGEVLGRVVSIEGAAAFAAEGASAYAAALLLDVGGMGAKNVALTIGTFGLAFVTAPVLVYCQRSWSDKHGKGYRVVETKDSDIEMMET